MQNPISKVLKKNEVKYFKLYSETTKVTRRLHWWRIGHITPKLLGEIKRTAKRTYALNLKSVELRQGTDGLGDLIIRIDRWVFKLT
jgi:hypothetical protein